MKTLTAKILVLLLSCSPLICGAQNSTRNVLPPGVQPLETASAVPPQGLKQKVSIQCDSGTLAELITILQDIFPTPINVVLADGAGAANLPEFDLVDVPLEIFLMSIAEIADPELIVNIVNTGENQLVIIRPTRQRSPVAVPRRTQAAPTQSEEQHTRTYPIADIMEAFGQEEVEGFFETYFTVESAKLSYHPGTGLLILKGDSAAHDDLDELLRGLESSAHLKTTNDQEDKATAVSAQLKETNDQMAAENLALRQEMSIMASRFQAEMEAAAERNDRARRQGEEYSIINAKLREEIAALKAELDARK